MAERLTGFPPVADGRARVLVLGTMPSVRSLACGQYYGHPQNAFWRIVFALWGLDKPQDYELCKVFLLDNNIALWDVLAGCVRPGSADAAITEPLPNDFRWLAAGCPRLHTVVFNSQSAEALYRQLVKPDPFAAAEKLTLPSTSPARAMAFEKKLELWRPLRDMAEQ